MMRFSPEFVQKLIDGIPTVITPQECSEIGEQIRLGTELVDILSRHAGESGASEGAVECLNRIIADRTASKGEVLKANLKIRNLTDEADRLRLQLKSAKDSTAALAKAKARLASLEANIAEKNKKIEAMEKERPTAQMDVLRLELRVAKQANERLEAELLRANNFIAAAIREAKKLDEKNAQIAKAVDDTVKKVLAPEVATITEPLPEGAKDIAEAPIIPGPGSAPGPTSGEDAIDDKAAKRRLSKKKPSERKEPEAPIVPRQVTRRVLLAPDADTP